MKLKTVHQISITGKSGECALTAIEDGRVFIGSIYLHPEEFAEFPEKLSIALAALSPEKKAGESIEPS